MSAERPEPRPQAPRPRPRRRARLPRITLPWCRVCKAPMLIRLRAWPSGALRALEVRCSKSKAHGQ